MEFFNQYVQIRFGGLKDVSWGEKTVVFANFGLTHHIWHDSEEEWMEFVEEGEYERKWGQGDRSEVKVWVLGPFFAVERESSCTAGRLDRFREIGEAKIKDDGWLGPVDWVPISMALSAEMATALDGMHVVGPSMKVLFHMAVHQICG